ncbi:MAG: histidinol-phosphatase [Rhodobiaceae bacterium]|nr:histidinol-phosphatase [Rhodobiaceae bacterium]
MNLPSGKIDSDLIPFALELAAVAAPETLRHFRTSGTVENKAEAGQIDPVTAGDRNAEAAMRRLIGQRYPDHGIIGEEYGTEGADREFVWVLDPIDGTRAFVLGLPVWGTLIGLLHEGRPIAGVMAQPFVGDLFYGSAAGSFLKRGDDVRPLRAGRAVPLASASIATTSPKLFDADDKPRYDRLEAACGLVRYGTDCYGYALLAGGHVDLVVESGLKPFDIVALIPIVEGAGGQVTDWAGGSAAGGGRVLAAGDPALHAAAMDYLSG